MKKTNMNKNNKSHKNNNILKDIKSTYIMKMIFSNLEITKYLNIIRYNKKYQKRLEKTINDYIKAGKIEIELIPIEKGYGEFIQCENYDFYHIYFNDNKEEIKRNYLKENEKVSKIKIIIDYQIKTLNKLFRECECIKKINFISFNRTDITDMSFMFWGCSSLEELNLSNFRTNKVTNMRAMFSGCSSLKEINLSNFNTNYVTDMSFLFSHCSALKELNLSNFKTNNVTEMKGMFSGCSSLKELNISNFKTNNVIDMSYLFWGCSLLKELNISNFNASKVNDKDMKNIFEGCLAFKKFICSDKIIMTKYENRLN